MTEVAATHGYGGASVARVVAAAGVSRATYYEHFRDRDACFVAAYRSALERVDATCAEVASRDPAWPSEMLRSLLGLGDEDPALARLLLVEALAGPPGLRNTHHDLLADAEGRLLEEAPCGLLLPPNALYGGVTAVLASSLLADEEQPLRQLQPPIEAWVKSYSTFEEAGLWDDVDWSELGRGVLAERDSLGWGELTPLRPVLPRGRSALPTADAAADRKRRIVEATCEVVARKGYGAASVADVVAAARVTRGAFYSHFRCKEDAVLAALTQCLQESVAATAADYFLSESWPDRVWGGLRAFLRYLTSHPDAARLGMIEVYSVGEPALRRSRENRLAFTLFLADGYTQSERAERLPTLCSEAIAGAIEAIVRRRLLIGSADRIPQLLPQCAYVTLAPFIGAEGATNFVLMKARGAPSAVPTA